ncbi:SOCS box domain-containing protein [Aphelenchoides besseyi]|nr:SOCS box domain-containing protein [Aphelenchoides besseyi]
MRNYYQQFFHNYNSSLDMGMEQHQKQRLLADKINSFATIEELRLLLVQGAQVGYRNIRMYLWFYADGIVTLGLRPLHYAVFRHNFDAAKLLIVRGAKVDAVDDIGYSALHLCAEKGSFRMLKFLLEHLINRQKCVRFESKDQQYPIRDGPDEPLRLAIWQDHYDCAKLLLEQGADPNTRYFDGPQITLVEPREYQYIRLLLEFGANPNVLSRKGISPLMKSCELGEVTFRTSKLLIEHGADVNAVNFKSSYPMSVLHYAVGSGDLQTVKLLLEHGAKVNLEVDSSHHRFGSHPPVLHYAVMSGNLQITQLLLEHGADVHCSGTIYGNALHLSCCHRIGCDNYVEMVELLLNYKADPNSICCNSNGIKLRSPVVEFFRRLYKFEVTETPIAMTYKFKYQMEDRPGQSQWANIVQLLFSHGAYFDITDDNIEVDSMNIVIESKRPEYADYLGDYVVQMARSVNIDAKKINENSLYLTKEHLERLETNPRTLRECCRNLIRSQLSVSEDRINQLPLPIYAKKYLLGTTLL